MANATAPHDAVTKAVTKLSEEVAALRAEQKANASKAQKLESLATEFEKASKTAARNSGMSPQDYFYKMSDGGKNPVMLMGDGTPIPVVMPRQKSQTRRIGKQKNYQSGETVDFGEYLHHQRQFQTKGYAASQSVDFLHKAGAFVAQEVGDDGMIRKTALAESSGVTGGYGVPPVFSEQLLSLAAEDEVIGSRATVETMESRTKLLPSLDIVTNYGAGITPFLGGVQATWSSEASTLSESEPKLRQTELTAWQLSFYLVFSNVLWQDQAVGLDSLVTTLMSKAIGWYSDYAFIQGNGVGKPMGIQNCAAAIQVSRTNAGAYVNWYDIPKMFKSCIYNNHQDLIWVAHPGTVAAILEMNDQSGGTTGVGTGRVLWVPWNEGAQADIPRPAGPQSFGKLLGKDLFLSEKMNTLGNLGDLMLVDPTKYVIGKRMDLEIDISPHVYFTSYQTVMRVVARMDGQPWLQGPITLADGSYTVSPFLVLK